MRNYFAGGAGIVKPNGEMSGLGYDLMELYITINQIY